MLHCIQRLLIGAISISYGFLAQAVPTHWGKRALRIPLTTRIQRIGETITSLHFRNRNPGEFNRASWYQSKFQASDSLFFCHDRIQGWVCSVITAFLPGPSTSCCRPLKSVARTNKGALPHQAPKCLDTATEGVAFYVLSSGTSRSNVSCGPSQGCQDSRANINEATVEGDSSSGYLYLPA